MRRTRSGEPALPGVPAAPRRPDADLHVVSQLDSRWLPVLERLLFFNDQQHAVRARVAAAIEQYGTLHVDQERGSLRLRLGRLRDAQSLFCVLPDGRPVGCIVYSRDATDRFLVLHVAVEPAYTARGRLADGDVLLRMVGAVRAAARRTRGVERVDLLYAAGRMRSLKVRSSAQRRDA